jgi:hypothetical protein
VIIGVVITLVVGLAIAVIVAVARDPGPTPDDVAIGYARALAAGDFDAVYRLIDPDLLHGRNRPSWVAAQTSRPRLAFSADAVAATGCVRGDDVATVTLRVDGDRTVPVELVRRQRMWVVARFDGVEAATAR